MNWKLVCSDIDGTLLNKDRQLSQRTIEVLKRIKDIIPLVLISSRMPKAMRHLQKELDILSHPLIAFNGGLVLDYSRGEPKVLSSIEIPVNIAELVIKFSKDTSIHTSLYHSDEWYVAELDYWAKREMNNTKVHPEVADLQSICEQWKTDNRGAHKIMCMGEVSDIQLLYNYLNKHHSETIHVYRSKDTYIEIASKEISKLSALDLLLDHSYDINLSEVVAFGDNYNDEEMIGGVGLGVAVANAREEVKAVCNAVTKSNKEDGVAFFLEGLLGAK
ncbi:MAG: Cof subfamily protein (haloacid dehalogenase superfamily) [Saprospiraceae bacterium]|jgi:Cof subfamily protein (haloacid dehalogenase superfamily)|tara:strand:+ start:864 stop:1688 length:825 start_codon:yes stop_codon:yes gene_type:complete